MLHSANIFQPLIDVFETVLRFFHNSVGVPWGWSIVLLTVVIRALLVPLTLKQFHSMQRLQRLQPQMKAIQTKYKEDKQRQQQELMKFYKENQVNPLGSCLPLVAQLPVFVSLFYMLRQSLRADICPSRQPGAHFLNGHWVIHSSHTAPCGPNHGAGFLFIPDLTNKATGAVLIVLIVLYVATQLASSLMMATPTMEKTQRQLMLLMPLFFVIFIISFPAGVIVYWITTNAWTILQQYIVRKRIGPMGAPATTGAEAGDGAGPNGSGAGGLGALLRSRLRPPEAPAAVGAGSRSAATGGSGAGRSSAPRSGGSERRSGPPPPSPRKKKKRSGRRR